MTGFGSALRAERERCGLTLDAVSSQTKVTARHLEALESEEFSALPGGVFRKGIVHAYVAALGLEDGPWMERFQRSLEAFSHRTGTPLEPEAWETFAENVKRSRPEVKRKMDLRWVALLAMILFLVAAGWAAWHYVIQPRLEGL